MNLLLEIAALLPQNPPGKQELIRRWDSVYSQPLQICQLAFLTAK